MAPDDFFADVAHPWALSEDGVGSRGVLRAPEQLAEAIVARGVAPDAAAGFAVWTPAGWEVRTGWAVECDRCAEHDRDGCARADREALEPIFDLASVTKPMTAFALARSSLPRAALLGAVLEEARGTSSAATALELLLAHRAGLAAHVPLYEALVDGRPFERAVALRRAADARRADVTGAPPPEGFPPVYSDLGFLLVGEALARVERAEDAGEVIERLVVDALGRDDLGTARALAGRGIDFERRVRPTEIVAWRGGEVRGVVHDENAWALTASGGSGHAGMFGTVGAVLAFGCAALDALEHGRGPLAGAALEWIVRPRPGGTLRAGFDGKSASGSSAGDRAGPRTFGHLGFTGTSVWIDPDAQVVAAVLTNRVYPARNNPAIRAARPAAHDALFAMADAARRSAL